MLSSDFAAHRCRWATGTGILASMGRFWINPMRWARWLAAMAGLSVLALTAAADWIHPNTLPQPDGAPAVLMGYVEIPKGGTIKYEVDPTSGHLVVDRFLPAAWAYPHAYGFVPSIPASDGDALDVFILTDQPLVSQSVVPIRPVGLIRLLDAGQADHKLLAVPVAAAQSVLLGEATITALRTFLTRYKAKPGEDNPIEWLGIDTQAQTLAWLRQRLSARGRHRPSLPPSGR